MLEANSYEKNEKEEVNTNFLNDLMIKAGKWDHIQKSKEETRLKIVTDKSMLQEIGFRHC